MSYNVSSTVTLSCSLTITHEKAVLLRHAGVLAEGHFLDEEVVRIPKLHCTCVKCGAKVEGMDVDLPIRETEPGVQGDRVSGARKPATLITGLVVQVPLFVGPDDIIRVDTRTGEYITRANG